MNKRKIAVGPGASSLILIAMVLALSVLTILTMISARNDEALIQRSVETRQEVYGLFADAEKSLAKLDAELTACLKEQGENLETVLAALKDRLPEGMTLKQDQVSWTEREGKRSLECAVRILEPGAEKRTQWTAHRLNAEDIWEDEGFDDSDSWENEEEPSEAEDDGSEAEEEPAAADAETAADDTADEGEEQAE